LRHSLITARAAEVVTGRPARDQVTDGPRASIVGMRWSVGIAP
jgi:hypothetical protein